MARTTQQQLDDLDAAIEAVETRGQSYSIGDRQLTRADLPKLYEERKRLEQKLSEEATGGGIPISYGVPPQ